MSRDIRKVFKDPVHGHIELHPLLVKMIDTPEFQRLRHIKQLGTKFLVFPGATHTRFAHSIGVAHLARCLVETLQKNQPELNITERDSLCVQIAALCHDMGHGPFSHLFDSMFIPEVKPDEIWEHEKASVDMFHLMRKKNDLDKVMKDYGLDLKIDNVFIEELILKGQKDGEWSMKGRTEDKSFLYEIVSNKVNGIDVDKWDYLTRDCYYIGIPCGFDHQRLLLSLRVCEVNGRKHICFRDKVAENVYNMFHTRYTLHRQVLQHKIGYIIDVKIKDALVKADERLQISAAKDNMLEYAKLTDHIFDQILNQTDSLPGAQGILKDIVERKLPKFVGEARLNENGLKEKLKQHWEETLPTLDERERNLCNELLGPLEVNQDEAFKIGKLQKILLDSLEGNVSNITETLNGDLKAHPVKAFKIKVYQKILKRDGELRTLANQDIYVLDMGFGEVGNEPIDNVHFYSKNDPDKAFKMEKYQVSSLKPNKFHEWLIRVYYKKPYSEEKDEQKHKDKQECHMINLHKAKKSFHEWCKNNRKLIDFGTDSGTRENTGGKEDMKKGTDKIVEMETSSGKVFHDSVHGQIELDHRLVMIIDTPEFQRLRHIKQLGPVDRVYPGATHTRFEHSLGMAYLAGLLANVLKKKQENDIRMIKKNNETLVKELQEKQDELINEKDILCVQIAALCYNLGHGPFSHLFEKFIYITQSDGNATGQEDHGNDQHGTVKKWKRASIWIFLDIVQKNDELKRELDQNDLTFIKTLIEGKSEGTLYPNKTFLYDIVENTWNGIDVRRWDYFARDCHHLGIQNSFDHQRLLKSARVCVADGKKHICFRDKVADNVYDMFHTRYMLYLQAYQHRTANSIQENIVQALIQAKDTLEIIPISESITNANLVEKAAKFIKLTDHIFERILYNDELIGAQQELEDVVKRRLPKCVGETRLAETEKDKETFQKNWENAMHEFNTHHADVFLNEKDFSTDVIQLDYNDDIGNPIDRVYFYRKSDHTNTQKIQKYEVSSLLPEVLTEYVGRVYYKKNSDEEEQDAKNCFTWFRHGKPVIELYSKPNFEGTKQVFTEDCPSLKCCSMTEVRSCKVLSGLWEFCQEDDYKKAHCQLSRGQYAKLDDKILVLSLKHVTSFKIQIYEEENFEGPVFDLTHHCPSVEKWLGLKSIRSCKVLKGVWKLYVDDDFKQAECQLEVGEYRSLKMWSSGGSPVPAHSVECVPFKIQLFAKEDFEEPMTETTMDIPSLERFGIEEVHSCKVLSGGWNLYRGSEYTEPMYPLESGKEYPNPQTWGGDNNAAQSVERALK